MARKIRVKRKGYWRKGYTRKDGVRIKRSWIPPTTFMIKDVGARGRTPVSKQWARFEKTTGWKKSQKPNVRRRRVFAATDRRRSVHDRAVEAGRMLNQLANVTTDKPTEKKARSDANYFFKRAKKTPERG